MNTEDESPETLRQLLQRKRDRRTVLSTRVERAVRKLERRKRKLRAVEARIAELERRIAHPGRRNVPADAAQLAPTPTSTPP